MANNNLTIFQRLNNVFRGTGRESLSPDVITTPPGMSAESNRVLFSTSDKNEYERKLNTYKQQKYNGKKLGLITQWKALRDTQPLNLCIVMLTLWMGRLKLVLL